MSYSYKRNKRKKRKRDPSHYIEIARIKALPPDKLPEQPRLTPREMARRLKNQARAASLNTSEASVAALDRNLPAEDRADAAAEAQNQATTAQHYVSEIRDLAETNNNDKIVNEWREAEQYALTAAQAARIAATYAQEPHQNGTT